MRKGLWDNSGRIVPSAIPNNHAHNNAHKLHPQSHAHTPAPPPTLRVSQMLLSIHRGDLEVWTHILGHRDSVYLTSDSPMSLLPLQELPSRRPLPPTLPSFTHIHFLSRNWLPNLGPALCLGTPSLCQETLLWTKGSSLCAKGGLVPLPMDMLLHRASLSQDSPEQQDRSNCTHRQIFRNWIW